MAPPEEPWATGVGCRVATIVAARAAPGHADTRGKGDIVVM